VKEPTYLTAEGRARLTAELEKLIRDERPRVADRIREAKALGDISDNADYEVAKQQQAFLEGRIATIQAQLRSAVHIGATGSTSVGLGSTVAVRDPEGEELIFTIVGAAEASPRDGRISNVSPLGSALLGSSAGQVVTVSAPAGTLRYEVVSVS
jgi:transcription elongation factor GreA